jgi:methionyl-tRNA formyltransferase
MRIVFFGTPEFAAEFLQGLLNVDDFKIVAAVTQPDQPVGRKKNLTPSPVKVLSLANDLPVLQPTKLSDQSFQATLKEYSADVGVVAAYGRLLPTEVLNGFPLGCINVHPSLLPKYRGPSPISSVIANGETETGVSIIQLVPAMDAGPILGQIKVPISEKETTPSLTAKVVKVGGPLLVEVLKALAENGVIIRAQDDAQATFCKLLTKEDGRINWQEPAEVIERKLRAFDPWPGSFTDKYKIFSVAISDMQLPTGQESVQDGRLFIGTGTHALEILELQPIGKKRMQTAAYLRGLR